MRQMLAEAGAPDFLLGAIQPGTSLADILAEAQRRAPELDSEDLLANLGEAMEPALARKGAMPRSLS